MLSLARSTLRYEWRRFLAAVLAVAFSGLLIIVQLALLLGMFGTVSLVVDQSRADLWVSAPNTPSFDLGRYFPLRNESLIRMHPDIMHVESLLIAPGDWRAPDGSKTAIFLVGIDVRDGSLGTPSTFDEPTRQALQEPGGVVIDVGDERKLKATLGQTAELNNKRVKVVGVVSGFKNIGGAYIFGSLSTVRRLLDSSISSETAPYLLVKIRHPDQALQVQQQLQMTEEHPRYTVWTKNELSTQSQLYWLFESGAGAGFGFSSLLGLAVGVVITGQILRGTILASIREYATLRALGVSVWSLNIVVLEQAWWVGLAGLVVTGILTATIGWVGKTYHVAMRFPWWSLVGTATITMLIAIVSGAMAIRVLYKAEPGELLR